MSANLFRQLTEKPWLTPGHHAWANHDGKGEDLKTTAVTGLKLYFAVASVLFGLIFVGYLMRGNHLGMEHQMPKDWRPLPKTWLLWYNSGVLILSSIAWEWARSAARQGNRPKLQMALLSGGTLAFIFLIGQLAVWQLFHSSGYLMTTNMAVAFFYVMIVLHGLHLLGGLSVWAWATVRALGHAKPAELILSVDLCTRYWHFLLAVWLVMFGLLLLG